MECNGGRGRSEWQRSNCRRDSSNARSSTCSAATCCARLGMCMLTAVALWAITGSWAPPFAYRTGYVPPRDIVAKVVFTKADPQATRDAQEKALPHGALRVRARQSLAAAVAGRAAKPDWRYRRRRLARRCRQGGLAGFHCAAGKSPGNVARGAAESLLADPRHARQPRGPGSAGRRSGGGHGAAGRARFSRRFVAA